MTLLSPVTFSPPLGYGFDFSTTNSACEAHKHVGGPGI